MSVETADPPPLLFSPRSPSPPSFSPQHSPAPTYHAPNDPQHFQHMSQPQALSEDVDMSMSITLPPQGQNHDRHDGRMDMMDADSNEVHIAEVVQDSSGNTAGSHSPSDSDSDDVMDTTPDGTAAPANGSQAQESDSTRQSADSSTGNDAANITTPPPPTDLFPPPPDPNGFIPSAPDGTNLDHAQPPTSSRSPSPQPDHDESNRNRNDISSDDDEAGAPWHELPEDTSVPDERELKEIEAETEYSALDHEHWEEKTFTKLEDPEYAPGVSGRIEWTIDAYNGTKDSPNKELVMKSHNVKIGGHEWQIKFYPRGNSTDSLSIYVECASFNGSDKTTPSAEQPQYSLNPIDKSPNKAALPSQSTAESEDLPIPLFPGHSAARSNGISAQVSVLLYNPSEPRVHCFRTCTHRFCANQPDWGFTRFHGPYNEIHQRHRGQRQALLQNDKLAFTAYIRLVDDTTGCLWEHSSTANPWNSFALTGVQGLSLSHRPRLGTMIDGNFVSAISSWMMLMPFRELLYKAVVIVPDPVTMPREKPKPLLKALMKVLYCLRTPDLTSKSGSNVGLEDVTDALSWYGIDTKMDTYDVVQVQEVLRTKLEYELEDTMFKGVLDRLFGPMKDHSTAKPTYRVSAKNFGSIRDALADAEGIVDTQSNLPHALQIEIERQELQKSAAVTGHSPWKKLNNKVVLDDHVAINGIPYTLYSFVIHEDSLQSGKYYSVIRPLGPNGKWYNFLDGKEQNKVQCLTKRQAIAASQGYSDKDTVPPDQKVAYLVTYLRDDIAEKALDVKNEPVWNVPAWLESEAKFDRDVAAENDMAIDQNEPNGKPDEDEKIVDAEGDDESTLIECQIIDSRLFQQHYGPGTVDMFANGFGSEAPFVHDVLFPSTANAYSVKEKLMEVVGAEDPRQCKIWVLDAHGGTELRPNMHSTGSFDLPAFGKSDQHRWTIGELAARTEERRFWVHVIDKKDLPPMPAIEEPQGESTSNGADSEVPPADGAIAGNTGAAIAQAQIEALLDGRGMQDTLMSDATEMSPEEQELARRSGGPVTIIEIPTNLSGSNNAESSNGIPPPPGGNLQIAASGIPGMEIAVPAAVILQVQQSGPSANTTGSDEIYFFLKVFDVEKQQLRPIGSFLESKKARLDHMVLKHLNMPTDTDSESRPELFEEDEFNKVNPLRRRKTFIQEDLHDTCIVIAAFPITDEKKASLRAQGLPTTPQQYLEFQSYRRNFPHLYRGSFTFDYFSSEYYSGDMLAGQHHGYGTKIAFDGTQYTGDFVLSSRHGKGALTYKNGDTYTGEFVDGLRSGNGTFVEQANGNKYEGGWKADKKFGEGVTYWAQAQESERICRICWDEGSVADAAFYDCGHVVACVRCAKMVDTCPICRRRVMHVVKLFFTNIEF